MLEHNDRKQEFTALIDSFPCRVKIPSGTAPKTDKRSKAFATPDERRRYQRVYCGGYDNRIGLEYQSTLPKLPREPSWHRVYVANVSRDGVAFLHSEPLYPREQMRLLLHDGHIVSVEIIDCRRIGTNCFEIGAHISAGQNSMRSC